MKIEHIIFDCDGVLVDSEIVAAEVMTPVLNTLGLSTTVKHYLSQYTGKTFRAIFEDFDIDQRVDIEMLIKNVEEKVYQNITAIEGIVDIVNDVALPRSVVSNSNPGQIEQALTAIDLLEVFENKFSSSMVEQPKPSPMVYNFAAKKLGLNPEQIIVIEDSVSGCTAALEAEMHVIGFCAGKHIMPNHADKLRSLGVAHIAENSQELRKLLSQLTKNELGVSNS